MVVLSALLEGRPEGQEDDLRVDDQEVEQGTAALREHHADHVLLGVNSIDIICCPKVCPKTCPRCQIEKDICMNYLKAYTNILKSLPEFWPENWPGNWPEIFYVY